MTRAKVLTTLLGATLLATSTAAAQTNYPIDDFEILPFSMSQPGIGTVTNIYPVPPPAVGHVISSTRQVTCTVFAGSATATAQLSTSGLENAVAIGVPSNAQVTFTYPLSPAGLDLTAGGTVDRIEMDIRRTGEGAAEVGCGLDDTSGPGFLSDRSVPGSSSFTVITWPLTAFPLVDLENVTEIQFYFPDPSAYEVREIRLRGTSSTDVNYELYAEATMVPPLPSPPVAFAVLDAVSNPLFQMDIAVTEADAGFTPGLQWAWTTVPSMAGQALEGLLDWTDPAPFDELLFAFSVDVQGGESGLFAMLYPPDPIQGPEGMTLAFPVMLSETPGGTIVGSSEVWLTIDPGSEQAETAMEFAEVMVTPTRGTGMTGFEVSFRLIPGAAGVETIWPILETRAWMDWSQTPVTDVGDVLPPNGGTVTLTATPSVTLGGTELRAARPFERTDVVGIHDVRGRLLASLRPQAGARAVVWDGRDDAGGTLPAGVYFVHLKGAMAGATRVVKIR